LEYKNIIGIDFSLIKMTLLIKLILIYKSNEPIFYMYIVYAIVCHVNIAFKDVSLNLCISKIYKFYKWFHYYI